MASRAGRPVISVHGLTVDFGGPNVLEDLDIDIHPGEILALVGASGAGKSVLMRAILGLVRPQAGEIQAFGETIGRHGPTVAMEKRWGVLFQFGALFSALTVAQNVAVPMREFLDLPDQLVHGLARLKIELVGLRAEDGDKYPAELSGGMIKRAALARALALDPDVLFLDEPTAGLDPIGAAAFDELIENLKQRLELTVFLITHDLDTLHAICDRVAVLSDKKVVAVGTIEELLALDHPWIQEYFNGPRGRAASAGLQKGHRGN